MEKREKYIHREIERDKAEPDRDIDNWRNRRDRFKETNRH